MYLISLIISMFILNCADDTSKLQFSAISLECLTMGFFFCNKDKYALVGKSLPVMMRFAIFAFLKASLVVVERE